MKYFTKEQKIKEIFEFTSSEDVNISDATLNYLQWVFQ